MNVGARSVRAFSKVAYEKGVVIAKCGGCQVQHLLSDRFGWFGDKGGLDDFLREKGESLQGLGDGTFEFTQEDLMGLSQPVQN